LHRELVDVGYEVFFALPAFFIKALEKVTLTVEEAYAYEGDVEIGSAFDVIAGENAEATGVNGERLVETELRGEVGDGAGAKNAGISSAPGAVSLQIFLAAAVDVVDAAVEDQLGGSALDFAQRHLVKKSDGVLIEFAPANGVQVAEEVDAVLIPAPPDVAGEGPKAFLGRSDKAIEGAGFADDGGDLIGGFSEHPYFVVAEDAGFLGLHDEDALENAAIDERDTEEGAILLFAGFLEVFVAGVTAGIIDGDGADLFGDKAGKPFMKGHAESADAVRMEAERSGKDEIGTVRFEQICGADVCVEA
jgi:hypothetical protein